MRNCTAKERDLYRAGFLAAMQWYGCDQDEIERCSVSVSDDIESGMIDKAKGAEEHRQLKAMWNALTANAAPHAGAVAPSVQALVGSSVGGDK